MSKTNTVRRHITIPHRYYVLFKEYLRSHPHFTLSSLAVTAVIEKISRSRGPWLRRIQDVEKEANITMSEDDFSSLTREEKWKAYSGT